MLGKHRKTLIVIRIFLQKGKTSRLYNLQCTFFGHCTLMCASQFKAYLNRNIKERKNTSSFGGFIRNE